MSESKPEYRVHSLQTPCKNKNKHTHDRWTVDIRNDQDIPRDYDTKYDGGYNKEQAKKKARAIGDTGDRILIQNREGGHLKTEVIDCE